MAEDKDYEVVDNLPLLNLSSKESLFLVSLPSDLDIASLKGIKINLQRDEDKVVKTRSNKDVRMTKEMASDMDNVYRALARDSKNNIVLAPEFAGVIKFTNAIPKLSPMTLEEVNALKIDHPYSKVPQIPDLKIHATPIGSLSTVEEVNKRNKRKASSSSSTEQTPKKSSKIVDPVSEVKSDKKKEKKEKKDKKDKK